VISPTPSVSSQLRRIHSRRPGREAYFREIVKLADLGPGDAFEQAEHLLSVRARMAVLEARVRELEARR
jgi:hypothetical protein